MEGSGDLPVKRRRFEEHLEEGRRTKKMKTGWYRRDSKDEMSCKPFERQVQELKAHLQQFSPKMNTLKELDLFVLDNSLRETTVGQVKGHTLEDKFAIYDEVKRAGFKHCIVESFHHMTRLGDTFLVELKKRGDDMSLMYAFTELFEDIDENKVPKNDIPIGLRKCMDLGINNVVMEIDLLYYAIDYNKFNAKKLCDMLLDRLRWIHSNLAVDSRVFINFRDFSQCMKDHPRRLFKVVNYISSLTEDVRPFGIIYEDLGKYFPEELGVWTKAVRTEMTNCGWTDGHLLVHVHEQWGLCDAAQLECLANGANGIWAGLCVEGAAMGHASSCVTIMNLVRMGNKKVLETYNCPYLRTGAQAVTNITTGKDAHPKQAIYGSRALDVVFGFDPPGRKHSEFDFAEFVGEKPECRITTLSTPEMFVQKLKQSFGELDQFTLELGQSMRVQMLDNLRVNRKEEANSKVGLAMLFDQSGGKMTEAMSKILEEEQHHSVHTKQLIEAIKERWDVWDISDGVKDDELTFLAFYNGFMAPYFGCYRCEDSIRGLQAIDMDRDGRVDWREFELYLKWAARQYPDTETADDLLDIAFRKGLIPAMQDELSGTQREEAKLEKNAEKMEEKNGSVKVEDESGIDPDSDVEHSDDHDHDHDDVFCVCGDGDDAFFNEDEE